MKAKYIIAIAFPMAMMLIAVVATTGLRVIPSVDSPWIPKCTIHRLTGLHCPGCGTTRAVHAIANGRVQDALRFNPLLILGLPVMILAIAVQRHRERRGHRAVPGLAWAIVVVLCVYTLARNLPSPDRGWLAPPPATSNATVEVVGEVE